MSAEPLGYRSFAMALPGLLNGRKGAETVTWSSWGVRPDTLHRRHRGRRPQLLWTTLCSASGEAPQVVAGPALSLNCHKSRLGLLRAGRCLCRTAWLEVDAANRPVQKNYATIMFMSTLSPPLPVGSQLSPRHPPRLQPQPKSPPATGSVTPVMYEASSEARNRIADACSAGVP